MNMLQSQAVSGVVNKPIPDGPHKPDHKLIIGAIRGEGMVESKNFFQASGNSRIQGQNVTHEIYHGQQDAKTPGHPSQSTHGGSKTQPPRLKNVKF